MNPMEGFIRRRGGGTICTMYLGNYIFGGDNNYQFNLTKLGREEIQFFNW